jgi:lysophospholipase L1-like esterase
MQINAHSRIAFVASVTAFAVTAFARAEGEAPPRLVGVVDQPCLPARTAAEEDRPRNDWAFLCRYEAENSVLGRSATPRVVFMGDSITESWKVAHPEFFNGGFIDRGISGQTSGQMLVRFRQDVIALRPAVVHIMAGTNDVAGNAGPTTLQAIKNNIISMVDLARANGIRVVLASIPPAGAFPWQSAVVEPAKYIVTLNAWLRQYTKDRGLVYADYHKPLADDHDAMKETFSNDGVHPNREGYLVMEPVARRAIEEALATGKLTADKRGRIAVLPPGQHGP